MDNPDLVHATGGYLHCKANYRLIADNLLDLSHVAFLHPLIGDQSMSRGKLTVSAEGRAVQSKFWMADTAAPPAVNFVYPTGSSVDQWLDMRWQAPSNLFLDFGLVGVGLLRERSAYHGYAYHVLTPETDVTTHYFFGVSMPAGVGSAAAEQLHDLQKSVFSNEDKPMLEDCQRSMGTTDLWSLKPVILGGDRGAIRARQMLDRLIDEESSPTLPAT